MFVVYFIAIHKRVVIGRTTNLYARVNQYERLGCQAEILGLIYCTSLQDAKIAEIEVLERFQFCKYVDNHDVFYLSSEMVEWIVDNTSPLTTNMWEVFQSINNRQQYAHRRKKSDADNIGPTIDYTSFRLLSKPMRIDVVHKEYSSGRYSKSGLAKKLGISTTTINNYLKERRQKTRA